jgi:hypothetical protein
VGLRDLVAGLDNVGFYDERAGRTDKAAAASAVPLGMRRVYRRLERWRGIRLVQDLLPLLDDLLAPPVVEHFWRQQSDAAVMMVAVIPAKEVLTEPARILQGAHHRGLGRYPGIKIHDARIIRLLEVLLHGSNTVGGWTAKEIHQAVLTTFQLSPKTYGLNQLRYDLRKLKGHGLLQRDGTRYAYRLTTKGVPVALLFLFFLKRLCGPPANSRFHHTPDPAHAPDSKLEAAYHKADKAIQNIVDLLAAA